MLCIFQGYELAPGYQKATQMDDYHIVKAFGQCFDSGTVLLATKRSTHQSEHHGTYYAVKKYHLEDCQKDINSFLKVYFISNSCILHLLLR